MRVSIKETASARGATKAVDRGAGVQRRRFKNVLSFPDRLANEAKRLREKAEATHDELLKKARQADVTAHMDEWLSSPGLRPPD
jgi:hypothetical protein